MRRVVGLLMCLVATGVAVEPALAAPKSKLAFTTSSLQPSTSIELSQLVSTWSGGPLSFGKVTGSCSVKQGKRRKQYLKIGAEGTCRVTVKQGQSPKYPAARISRKFEIVDTRSARIALMQALSLPNDQIVRSKIGNYDGRQLTTLNFIGKGTEPHLFPWEQVFKSLWDYGLRNREFKTFEQVLAELDRCRTTTTVGKIAGGFECFLFFKFWHDPAELLPTVWIETVSASRSTSQSACFTEPGRFCNSTETFIAQIKVFN